MKAHILRVVLALVGVSLLGAMGAGTLFGQAPAQKPATGAIYGTIRDTDGNPWPGIVVNFYGSSKEMEATVTTADNGKYRAELAPGVHVMKLIHEFAAVATRSVPVYAGTETLGDMNFKYAGDTYNALRAHYEAGDKALKLVEATRDQLDETSPNEQAALLAKINSSAAKAMSEFQKAFTAADPNDSFFDRFVVLSRLGQAYDAGGKEAQAVESYRKALALHQDANVYDNLGNALAKEGDFASATSAYQRSMELDPDSAGRAYRDLGISFYNADRLNDALVPLRTSTQLDPRNPQGWYVLGATLVGAIEKRRGNESAADAGPGREKMYREALDSYQKAIDLDSSGKWRTKAQAGMKQLREISRGTGAQTPRNLSRISAGAD
jgi:tetratricopeptide (TPR) repeat protein